MAQVVHHHLSFIAASLKSQRGLGHLFNGYVKKLRAEHNISNPQLDPWNSTGSEDPGDPDALQRLDVGPLAERELDAPPEAEVQRCAGGVGHHIQEGNDNPPRCTMVHHPTRVNIKIRVIWWGGGRQKGVEVVIRRRSYFFPG
ncbi:hypothetical protein BKA70DRAFT_1239712 [Coprinopsis sp. MPI-PUGE-AT-0042]|nr:hypothetical protein BKA70DRAFT_1239712 [Coprinopsis sp. MPI-PUGE-AT-0042]